MEVLSKPTLYKKASTGATQIWNIRVERTPEEFGEIVISYGQLGGKMQETREVIREGKNLGKKNATTAVDQAVAEAEAKWEKQKDRRHYGLDVEESAAKREVSPMLAQSLKDHKNPIDWTSAWAQPKLDGHRCLAFRDYVDRPIRLVSRQGKEITTLPHIQEELVRHMKVGDVLDGELYVHGVPLNTVGSWIKKAQEDSSKVLYNVYDMVHPARFTERIGMLDRLINLNRCVRRVVTWKVSGLDYLLAFQARCIADGYEGAMLRHGLAGYESGKRSSSLLKVKTFQDGEFMIQAVREGRGGFEGMAIFECLAPKGASFEVTAPGTHAEKRQAWEQRDSLIGKWLTVKYAYWTTTDNPVPFHPVALRIREDV